MTQLIIPNEAAEERATGMLVEQGAAGAMEMGDDLAEMAALREELREEGRPQRRHAGYFARKTGRRVTREEIVRRAAYLPAGPRGLLTARYELGMATEELAALHKVSRGALRRRLLHWCDVLADATFPLAVRFADRLPRGLGLVARDFFLEGRTMREIAVGRGISLHEVRCRIDRARALLLLAMAEEQAVPAEVAQALFGGVLNSETRDDE